MEYALRRFIERGLKAVRGNADWLREALRGGYRYDMDGVVASVDGTALHDDEKRFTVDLYGHAAGDGTTHPRKCQVVMVDGVQAGTAYDIVSCAGGTITLGSDIEAAGVAAGDCYQIRTPEDAEAVAYFAEQNVRVVLELPSDPMMIPCFVIARGSITEGERYVGRAHSTEAPVAGPVRFVGAGDWTESYTISCLAKSPQEAVLLGRVFEYLYFDFVRYFDSTFRTPTSLNGGALGTAAMPGASPFQVCVLNYTLSGQRQRFFREERPWLVDDDARVINVTTAPVVAEVKGGLS